jgi:hypothetical protein
MSTVDNITSFPDVKDGVVNQGYQSMQEENTNDEKLQ